MVDEPSPHRAEDVRGAEIVLRKRWQRLVFLGALVAFVLQAVIVTLAA